MRGSCCEASEIRAPVLPHSEVESRLKLAAAGPGAYRVRLPCSAFKFSALLDPTQPLASVFRHHSFPAFANSVPQPWRPRWYAWFFPRCWERPMLPGCNLPVRPPAGRSAVKAACVSRSHVTSQWAGGLAVLTQPNRAHAEESHGVACRSRIPSPRLPGTSWRSRAGADSPGFFRPAPEDA